MSNVGLFDVSNVGLCAVSNVGFCSVFTVGLCGACNVVHILKMLCIFAEYFKAQCGIVIGSLCDSNVHTE